MGNMLAALLVVRAATLLSSTSEAPSGTQAAERRTIGRCLSVRTEGNRTVLKCQGGESGAQMHNLFGLLYQMTMYDGTSYEFERGVYRITPMTCVTEHGTTTVTLAQSEGKGWRPAGLRGARQPRSLVFRVCGPQPKQVSIDGRPLPAEAVRHDAAAGAAQVETDLSDRPLTLRLAW